MTKENQKKLYTHFKELANSGATDKIRSRAKDRAANLLRIYPDFEEQKPEPAKTEQKPEKVNKPGKEPEQKPWNKMNKAERKAHQAAKKAKGVK